MKLYSINQYDGVADKIIVENLPNQTGCNTEMHRVAREARMDFCTTEPHSPWQNNAESVVRIIKVKSNKVRVQKIYPRWSGTLEWSSKIIYITSLYASIGKQPWDA